MPPDVKVVDRLTITFLVDNCTEWMSKLPPGFTHELPQHLQQQDHGTFDDAKGVPVLDFDNFCCGAHGFSALIETSVADEDRTHLTLFDTGPDSLSLVRNLGALEVPIQRIERVITSHWHSDHSGGLLSFLQMRRKVEKNIDPGSIPTCVVDVHPDRPIARGIAPGPAYDKVICAIPPDPSFEAIELAGGVLEKHSEGHAVANSTVWVSGEIPRVTEYEIGILGGQRWVNTHTNGEPGGKWITENHIMDERYAVIDVAGKGMVIFSACSHAGIVNVIKDAVSLFQRPIYMVIGGLHLAGPEFGPRIPMTVDFLSNKLRPAPTYVLPMHCSGFQAKLALEKAFGEGCVPAGVGIKFDMLGNKDADKLLFPSSY
ncbi:beta-lactamase-like protein [Gymnopilus junonius]|uniref:Beta-lactamase-like protein n=1 Tax=Gymnopilus junonius TaxID=109634 RepID=A0A9P5NL63_GYMJU|nr:beta-lactamase-like protein [Gymnopilus junonius]